jgi:hypothetical protein
VVPVNTGISDVPSPRTPSPAKVASLPRSTSATSPVNSAFVLPSHIMVVAAANHPTSEEVGEAISEFNSGSGTLLRDWPQADSERIVVVYDQLSVERIEFKRDHGLVDVDVDGRLSIGSKGLEGKRHREKQRWELRHTLQGWQLLAPSNRAYVPRDVAVHIMARRLEFLTQNGVTSDDLDHSLHQQRMIVRALGFLFDPT